MSRFNGKLEPIDLLRAQIRAYVEWLDAHPDARVIVFPNGRSDTTLRNVVNRELRGFFGGMREFVTVDPADYKPGLPVAILDHTDEFAGSGIAIIGAAA